MPRDGPRGTYEHLQADLQPSPEVIETNVYAAKTKSFANASPQPRAPHDPPFAY
jgi:hypothetical protein